MENPEVQEKLLREIEESKEQLDGKPLTYDDCKKLKYLDMVVSETLRKWPVTPLTDRACSKTITFENPDGLGDFTINEGENIIIPTAGLHRDPKYFPNPDTFDPERFSDENKHNIDPFTYIPFGAGPRICIANRLALMETKVIIYYLIESFKLEVCEKTTVPLDLSGGGFRLQPKNGFWLKFTARNK
uniref:Cytochrome P450 n=1 Tax=Megaselia scalaris TaxID=36166 RepID=T1GV75_MEGSC